MHSKFNYFDGVASSSNFSSSIIQLVYSAYVSHIHTLHRGKFKFRKNPKNEMDGSNEEKSHPLHLSLRPMPIPVSIHPIQEVFGK